MSQREHLHSISEDAGPNNFVEQDDIQEVLVALQRLSEKTRHPVARACLEQAHDDIVHLCACGEEQQVDDGESAAT